MTERRSRIAWPLMQDRRAAQGSPPRRLALIILYVAVIINMVLTGLVFSYVVILKSARDGEQQRIERLVDQNNCDLLSQLPAGALLDRLRDRYHCGPGLPAGKDPD